ncbi:MAG: hypothetical protein ACU836_07015 [Gammaproteobacteria bacterium]
MRFDLATSRAEYWVLSTAWFLVLLGGYLGPSFWLGSGGYHSIKTVLMLRAVIIVCLGYLFYPDTLIRFRTMLPLQWSVMLALAYFCIAYTMDSGAVFAKTAVNATISVFSLSLFIHSMLGRMAEIFNQNRIIQLYGLWVLLLLMTLPIWIAPWAELMAESTLLLSAMLWLSPITYLAAMLEYDYLRQEWFYQHLPYGGLRYDYPDTLYFSCGLVFLSFILWAKRRNA